MKRALTLLDIVDVYIEEFGTSREIAIGALVESYVDVQVLPIAFCEAMNLEWRPDSLPSDDRYADEWSEEISARQWLRAVVRVLLDLKLARGAESINGYSYLLES